MNNNNNNNNSFGLVAGGIIVSSIIGWSVIAGFIGNLNDDFIGYAVFAAIVGICSSIIAVLILSAFFQLVSDVAEIRRKLESGNVNTKTENSVQQTNPYNTITSEKEVKSNNAQPTNPYDILTPENEEKQNNAQKTAGKINNKTGKLWKCINCGNLNADSYNFCENCHIRRPADAVAVDFDNKSESKYWKCPNCENTNLSSTNRCINCGAPKP